MGLGGILALPDVTPAHAYGACEPYEFCPPWRECVRHDCYELGCVYGRTCYYGPADPPPRHPWRAEEPWTPEKHAWRDYLKHDEAKPPLPARRPAPPNEPTQTVDADSLDQDWQDEPPRANGDTDLSGDSVEMKPRRRAAVEGEIPERYQEAENTVGHSLTAIEAGASLYRENCASCHGAAGEGDGPRAQALRPTMPSLPYTLEQDYSTDAYLLWTIMEGGEPFGTEKPAFKNELTTEQAWQIIAYMRAGFPARSPEQPLRQTMQTQTSNTPPSAR
ncbi:c-type cytochrome [Dichotomicrobium thermohalophilum]|nr:cytochrome c [Dichotomicrobium thermohalophilum]